MHDEDSVTFVSSSKVHPMPGRLGFRVASLPSAVQPPQNCLGTRSPTTKTTNLLMPNLIVLLRLCLLVQFTISFFIQSSIIVFMSLVTA